MHFFDSFQVFHGELGGLGRVRDEEGVMGVAGGMLLRLEEGVKVPEAALDEVVRRHLGEAHLQEDLTELGADLCRTNKPKRTKCHAIYNLGSRPYTYGNLCICVKKSLVICN